MHFRVIQFDVPELFAKAGGLSAQEAAEAPGRTPGAHLYDVLKDMELRRGYVKPMGGEPEGHWEIGFGVEAMLERILAGRWSEGRRSVSPNRIRQQELRVDGLIMTPDDVVLDPPLIIVDDYKTSWKSAKGIFDPQTRKPLPDAGSVIFGSVRFWRWRMQLASYMRNTQASYGRIFPCFINGDYHPPRPWMGVGFELHLTHQEREEVWLEVLAHKRLMEREGRLPRVE